MAKKEYIEEIKLSPPKGGDFAFDCLYYTKKPQILRLFTKINIKFYANKLNAPKTPKDTMPIITPAVITPSKTAIIDLPLSKSSKLAANVPVQAPVPGIGTATKAYKARYLASPNFAPALWPFSRKNVAILFINFM